MNSEGALLIVIGLLLAVVVGLATRARSSSGADREQAELVAGLSAELHEVRGEQRRAEEIIERMAEGVLVLDGSLRPVLVNRSARTMLGLQQVAPPPRLPSEEVAGVARRALANEGGAEAIVTLWFPRRRAVRVRGTPLGQGEGIVVVLQDVTHDVRTQEIRREFVAHASHELKSPVASLQALAEALRHAIADDPAAAARFADRLSSEADRLGRLIRDLLDLSRLEDSARPPDDEIELGDVVRRELALIRQTADDADVDLQTSLAHAWVRGDDQHLGLMLRNLLDNAIRYTPSGGIVSVTLERDEADAVLTVADTGIGIPRVAQERIFERFYRVDRGRSRDRGGTGLGLAIVKHAVELHGGVITLESELGNGSTFTIRLPTIEPQRPHMRSVAG